MSEAKSPVSITGVEFPSMRDALPLNKFQAPTFPDRQPVVLVSCGSFSPITFLHLRLFEMARDYLMFEQDQFDVVGGIISPVHEGYGKKGLVDAHHRLQMCQLATASSSWISVSSWETARNRWSRTHEALAAYHDYLKETIQKNYSKPIALKLLCGADLLESCLDHNIWPISDLEGVFKHGVACIERQGHNSSDLIHNNDFLFGKRHHIHLVPQRISNNISSTAVRRQLNRGMSIRYLTPDSVVEYIQQHKLYKPSR